jgi:hypothetical protein
LNWSAIGAGGEVLGAVAVVLSLVYVAAQVRQNTKALRGAATANAIASLRDWNKELIGNPSVARIWGRGVESMDDLDEDGRAQFIVLAFNLFKTLEDMHFQFRQGSMDPEVWDGWESFAALYLKRPGSQQYWAHRRQLFSRPFRDWLDGLAPSEDLLSIEQLATRASAAPA